MIANDARCKLEIKSSIAIAKVEFDRQRTLFHQQIALQFKEETSEVPKRGHFRK